MTETTPPLTIVNREHWLNELILRLSPMLAKHGHKLPKYRISVGFPISRARPGTKKPHHIGECWGAESSSDGTHEIFISPTLEDALKVADVALHELLHAILPPGTGHKAPFARLAKACGLEGKPTATEAGDALKVELQSIIDELGPYPHGKLDATGRKKQTTRLLKVICPQCGYTARVTRTWIDEAGYPICPECQAEFIEPDLMDEVENPLMVTEQMIEFKFRGDDRFTLRLLKRGRVGRWYVHDWKSDTAPEARITPAEGRQDALNLIDSLREGLLTYKDLEDSEDAQMDVEFDGEPDPDEDWRDMTYLADDEDEFPDNLDSLLTPEEEAEYAQNQEEREAVCA